ncbi:DUF5717 family protein [Defluviitalea phaphyphila]|uniref:DUF5717 family protein n=1 Tax=Defluviitalea phaphyphila TaxID=1473580 RepID=UPI000730031E|nr:DUF5717 family protein [Defluviitalea phaphyphila]
MIEYKKTLIKAVSYWLIGQQYNNRGKDYFIKALDLLDKINIEDPTDIKVFLARIQLNINLERYEKANNMIKILLQYKKYFKENDKIILGILYYLKILLDYYTGRHIFIQSSIRVFDECLKVENAGILFFLKAKIEKELFEDEKNEIKYYYEAFKHGFRSPFLYLEMYSIFILNPSYFYSMQDVLKYIFIYSIKYKIINKESMLLFTNWMLQFKDNTKIPISYIKDIYNKWDTNELLNLLCKACIKQNKKDKEAFKVYESAIKRQLFIKNLYLNYLETAKNLNINDIPLSIIQSALIKENLSEDLKAYIYSIICTNEQYKVLFKINYKKILYFGENALKKNKKGKYYIDIYFKLLEKNPNNYLFKQVVFDHLFLYEISINSPFIKYIWVMENEKENMTTYTVTGNTLYIEAASSKESDLTILCLGNRQKKIYSKEYIIVKKLIKEIPIEILLQYYDEGYKNPNLLIMLTKHFIYEIEQNKSISNIYKKVEKIILECLENNIISNEFRIRASTALGSLFIRSANLEKAALYFKSLNPNNLNILQIQEGIRSFIKINEINLAIAWAKKLPKIENDICFELVKKSISLEIKDFFIINKSYELLLNGKYDIFILNYVINNYEGSLKDWYKLRDIVISLEKSTFYIDKKILEKGIWVHGLDEKLEQVFQSLYEKEPNSPLIEKFVVYCCYEILVNKKIVNKKTLEPLESIFKKTKNMILGTALLQVYSKLSNDVKDKKEIIYPIFSWMKKNQFILPIIKEKQDKFPYFSYIEENIPFIHYTTEKKEVNFCYKISGFPLIKKRMYHVAFNLYATCITLFYNESMEYYIEEIDKEGNYELTEVKIYTNKGKNIKTSPQKLYEKLNNTIIYFEDLEFKKAEEELENIIYENNANNLGYLI